MPTSHLPKPETPLRAAPSKEWKSFFFFFLYLCFSFLSFPPSVSTTFFFFSFFYKNSYKCLEV